MASLTLVFASIKRTVYLIGILVSCLHSEAFWAPRGFLYGIMLLEWSGWFRGYRCPFPSEHLWVALSFSPFLIVRSLECAHSILTASFTRHFLGAYCGLHAHCRVMVGMRCSPQMEKQKSLVVKTVSFTWEARHTHTYL